MAASTRLAHWARHCFKKIASERWSELNSDEFGELLAYWARHLQRNYGSEQRSEPKIGRCDRILNGLQGLRN